MRVIIEKEYNSLSKRAAKFVAQLVSSKPDTVLGMATGSTPMGLYRELIRMHREDGLDFSHVTTFNLDEYYGLVPAHKQSYHYFMHEQFFKHVNIPDNQINIPSGSTRDVKKYCKAYEKRIKKSGGIDLQILGIGSDGHIGFNEPGSSLGSRTRMKSLDKKTIEDNARLFFGDKIEDVPKFAITMGVGTVMDAKSCLLLASGPRKAEVIAKAVEGPVTAQVTASALQLHPDTTAVLDVEAASALERKDYYHHVETLTNELEKSDYFSSLFVDEED
ncbi:MAG: glucosamine-6-phosphate deaminase [Fibrobacterota bacterium]